MIRRFPIIPTVIVLLAVAVMIGLGVWQMQRADWKQNLLDHYRQALTMSSDVPYPAANPAEVEKVLYRHTAVDCRATLGDWNSIAGRNSSGEVGYVHVAHCDIGDGKTAYVQIGWSQNPKAPEWSGGEVAGIISSYNQGGGARLIASPPLAGLQANAVPDPEDLPNNHLAYAGQWFFFALTALIVYVLAVFKRGGGRKDAQE